jgi:hypothetical protein
VFAAPGVGSRVPDVSGRARPGFHHRDLCVPVRSPDWSFPEKRPTAVTPLQPFLQIYPSWNSFQLTYSWGKLDWSAEIVRN